LLSELSHSVSTHAPLHARGRPPFPTRRSSDLGLQARVRSACGTDVVVTETEARGELRGLVDRVCRDYPDAYWREVDETRAYPEEDRKSTRLNSSHVKISYAVFCLKKKRRWTYA